MVRLTLQYLKLTHLWSELFIRQFIANRLIFIGQLAEDVRLKSLNYLQKRKAIILWILDRELIAISIIQKFIRHRNTPCRKASFKLITTWLSGREQLAEFNIL